MEREEIFEAWIPPAGAWSLWARPVLFAQLPEIDDPEERSHDRSPWPGYDLTWAPPADGHTVLVLDLAGAESVYLGLALVARGFRPVPLFNGCTGLNEVVRQGPIQTALRAGGPYLRRRALPADAPPVFLLDASRGSPMRPIRPGAFDNRWQVYPEDFPAADVLQARGYTHALLVQHDRQEPRADLLLVLWLWQKAGLALMTKDLAQATPPHRLLVTQPPWYRRLWQHVLVWLGVRHSPPRGFGYVVPEPTHG